MLGNLNDVDSVKRLNRATVDFFTLLVILTTLISSATAQINAAPPSVTSLGFGGRAINGTPPSVTSIGPLGPVFNPAFPSSRPVFGMNPFQPVLNGHHHHHHDNGFIPWGGSYYAVPYGYYDQGDQADQQLPEDQYNGGPTIFDRRGPGRAAPAPQTDYAERTTDEPASRTTQPEATSVSNQLQTVLVFKNGHQLEVTNYAIVGSTLYDLTEGHRRKIPLSDLDLDATVKENGDRGIEFQVPAGS